MLAATRRQTAMQGWTMRSFVSVKSTRRIVLAGLCAAFVAPAAAQESYPTRPLRLIVPYSAGGASDVMARYLGAEARRYARPVGGGREPAGRGRQCRLPDGREGAARRLHADLCDVVARHQPGAQVEGRLRSGARFRPGLGLRRDAERPGRAGQFAVPHRRRPRRASPSRSPASSTTCRSGPARRRISPPNCSWRPPASRPSRCPTSSPPRPTPT